MQDDYRLRPSQPNIIIIIMTSSGKDVNWLPMNMNQWRCRDEGIGRVTFDRPMVAMTGSAWRRVYIYISAH